MEKWYFAVYTNCLDASREKEFNEWYDNIHLPDVFEVPGFVREAVVEDLLVLDGRVHVVLLWMQPRGPTTAVAPTE